MATAQELLSNFPPTILPFNSDKFVSLRNAEQSSTWLWNSCAGNKCMAESAIDEDKSTKSVTRGSVFDWWSAELTNITRIETILISASMDTSKSGYDGRFKVETRMSTSEPWKICKGEYSFTGSLEPHELQCDKPTTAKYLRLSVAGPRCPNCRNLYLYDVRVRGEPADDVEVIEEPADKGSDIF